MSVQLAFKPIFQLCEIFKNQINWTVLSLTTWQIDVKLKCSNQVVFLVRKILITTPIYLKYPWKIGLIVLRLVFTSLISWHCNACPAGFARIWLVAKQQVSQLRYCAWVMSIGVFALFDSWLSPSQTNIEGGFPHTFT